METLQNGLPVLDAIAIAGEVENLAFIDKPVENSGGDDGIAEKINPIVESLVGSNDE